MRHIVTIGGGSGQYTLLSSLRDIRNIKISAIVSMVDSGGSTGRLRDELGILPPGDILKCVLALSPDRDYARKMLLHRFTRDGRLNGHSAGNLLLTFLSQYSGSFPEGVGALGEILGVKGNILPVTIDKATPVAELSSGKHVYGETAIDLPRGDQREKIKRAFLVPHHADAIRVYPPVIKAIANARYVIMGPGDLYTSIIPNPLVPGVKEALVSTKAKIIYILNIMTKFGETDNFDGRDFVITVEKAMKRKFDFVIANGKLPGKTILDKYKKEKAIPVNIESLRQNGRKIIKENLIDINGRVVRHSSDKLGQVLEKIIKS